MLYQWDILAKVHKILKFFPHPSGTCQIRYQGFVILMDESIFWEKLVKELHFTLMIFLFSFSFSFCDSYSSYSYFNPTRSFNHMHLWRRSEFNSGNKFWDNSLWWALMSYLSLSLLSGIYFKAHASLFCGG